MWLHPPVGFCSSRAQTQQEDPCLRASLLGCVFLLQDRRMGVCLLVSIWIYSGLCNRCGLAGGQLGAFH